MDGKKTKIASSKDAVEVIKSLRETLLGNQDALTQLDTLEMMMFSNLRISSEILFRVGALEQHLGTSRLPGEGLTANGAIRELTKKCDKTITKSDHCQIYLLQTDGTPKE